MGIVDRAIRGLEAFFSSWRFPTLVVSVLVAFKALVLLVLFLPTGPTGFGAFAEEFKVWCFGYDPTTGKSQSAYVGLTLAEPIVLGTIILALWWRPLRAILRERPRAIVPYVAAAMLLVGAGAASLVSMKKEARAEELPFRPKDLRTAHVVPAIALTNQEGARVALDDQRGRVVLLTGVYASCHFTCPMILGQAKRAVSALTTVEQRDLTVMAVTLDPEHDNRDSLSAMARGQDVRAPLFNLLWGAPAEVGGALDGLGIARARNPETGIIDHANLFILVDRAGKIAFRFTLGDLQEKWLVDAMRLLIAERLGS